MEPGSFLTDCLSRPKLLLYYNECEKIIQERSADRVEGWQTSLLNPKNRINRLGSDAVSWKIDGCASMGTRFFAVPLSSPGTFPPRRIDVFISDQDATPWSLRQSLELGRIVACRHQELVAALEISRYIVEVLTNHFPVCPAGWQQRLPFGSSIKIENICYHVDKAKAHVIPAHQMERKTKSVTYLQQLWADEIPASSWPEAVDINALSLVKQLHDSISLVSLAGEQGTGVDEEKRIIFKSNTNGVSHLYHELRLLLRSPSHPHLVPKPLHIVTSQSRFGGKRGIVGFTLKYYRDGSINNILPELTAESKWEKGQQLRWCQQIVSGVMHAHFEAHLFLSDLRPDNILLATEEGKENLVICDFEQRGNWYEWCPPEILYAQYAESLLKEMQQPGASVAPAVCQELAILYESISLPDTRASQGKIENDNWPWFVLTAEQQEKAQVYMIGLIMYCIFEGTSNVRLNIANAYRSEDSSIQFPKFKNTPPEVQRLVRKYTTGAPEWEELAEVDSTSHQRGASLPPRARRVTRKAGNLRTEVRAGDKETTESENSVLKSGLHWWTVELKRASHFFKMHGERYRDFGIDRPTLSEVASDLEACSSLGI